jgi:hypothetical protein
MNGLRRITPKPVFRFVLLRHFQRFRRFFARGRREIRSDRQNASANTWSVARIGAREWLDEWLDEWLGIPQKKPDGGGRQ